MRAIKIYIYIILSYLFFCLPFQSLAQNVIPHFEEFTLEDGLSSTGLINIFQDSRGVIWIATSYGLNRYDGTSIKSYTKEDNGLCHNYVHKIEEDEKGNLWILSGDYGRQENYICILDPISEVVYSIEEYTGQPCPFDILRTTLFNKYQGTFLLKEDRPDAYQFYEVGQGGLVKGFTLKKDKKLNYYDKGKGWPAYKLNDTTYVTTMALRPKSVTGQFDNEAHKRIHLHHTGEITVLVSDETNTMYFLLICTDNEHLRWAYYSSEMIRYYDINDRLIGAINLTTSTSILSFWNKSKLYDLQQTKLTIYEAIDGALVERQQIQFENKLKPNTNDSQIDRNGNIWISATNKIIKLSLHKQNFEIHTNNRHTAFSTPVRGIDTDPNGSFFAANMIFLYEKEPYKDGRPLFPFNKKTKLVMGNMNGILYMDDTLWIASGFDGLGLYSLESGNLDCYGEGKGFLWMPYKAPDGTIWAGAGEGLFKLDKLKNDLVPFKNYNGFPKLAKSSIYAFHLNNKGTWLSTSSGMYLVDLINEKVIAKYSDTQEKPYYIPANHIAHIYEDKEGIFWLASKGQGLIRWDPTTGISEQLTKGITGLSHNVIYAVYEDDFGNLWLPSDYGLNCLNKTTRQVSLYLKDDGLPNNEFNTISHHQDKEGNLYFGTIDGMIKFHPKDFIQETGNIPFIITLCNKIDQRTDSLINITKSVIDFNTITLKPGDKAFDLHFALLDYSKPKGNQYSYKIEGYNENWIYQKESSIRISELPYGRHRLLIRAKASGSNKWIDYKQPIQIIVAKPIYLQWWFIISSLFLLIGSVVYLFKRNTSILIARQKELEDMVAERTSQIEKDKAFIEAQAEELKALDKVKSKFFANISHELRTPLTLILGPLSYVLENPDAWEKDNIQKQLLVMQRNGKSLMELIEEILDLSKLEANKLELQEVATPVIQFFEYLFFVFEPQFQSQGIEYDLVLNVKDDLHVFMDRKKMEKVLNNFLSNAIKFSPKGRKITLSVTESDTQLKIIVSDTGSGIHPNDLPHIFDRFYQSNQPDQQLYGGTGIGLALVNEFAQLMGGKAYAESTLGQGSKFYFEIPKKETVVEQMLPIITNEVIELEQIDSIGTAFTILIVEDNRDMRNFIFQLLEKKYERILSAKNGAEGLNMLKEHGTNIHLIISDVMMPEMDGLTMLKEIKNNPTWNGIPVVMLTALAAERDKLTALTIGVDDYLTKPFSVPELMIRVQNLLFNYHQRLEWNKTEASQEEENGDTQNGTEVKRINANDKKWVDELTELVKDSFGENTPLNVESLAALVFLSTRQLNRKLKSITGLSPAKFIKEVQLQAARQALENGVYISMSEVANNFGFEHPTTFSTIFKNRFGKSPSEYLTNFEILD